MIEYCVPALAAFILFCVLLVLSRSSQTSQFTITDAGRAALREEAEE